MGATATSSFLGNEEFVWRGDKRMCFFCLKDIPPVKTIKIEEDTDTTINSTPLLLSAQHDNHDSCHRFPLRNISRFLKFDGVESSMCDKGVVETCAHCFSLTEEFTELYKSLNKIQLRMNWCLRRINEVMEVSEKQLQLHNNDDDRGKENFKKSGFVALRKKTILNGQKKIRETSLPFVSVKRFRLTGQSQKSSEDISIQNTNCSVEENWDIKEQELLSCDRVPSINGQEKRTIDDNAKRMGQSRQDLHKNNQLDWTSTLVAADKADILQVKGESCFTEDEVEEEEHDFNLLTNSIHEDTPELLALEHFDSEPLLLSSPSNGAAIRCNRSEDASISRDHLSCPFCRATFITKESTVAVQQIRMSFHILQYHCENYYFPNQKLDSVTPFQYQKILYDLLFQDYCIEENGQYHCPFCAQQFLSRRGKHKWEHLARFKLHLINEHRGGMDAKLLEIQHDPRLSEKLLKCNPEGVRCKCGVYLFRVGAHQTHRRFHCTLGDSITSRNAEFQLQTKNCYPPPTAKRNNRMMASSSNSASLDLDQDMNRGQLSCPFCKAFFVTTERTKTIQEMRYNGHILQNHGEHIFPCQKLDMISDLQYKHIISDLLFRDYCVVKMNKLYCPFCIRSFDLEIGQQKSDFIICFKLHLLNEHRAQLENKLMEIQRSTLLPEELEGSSSGSEGISGVSYHQNAVEVEASASNPEPNFYSTNSGEISPPNAELELPENPSNNPRMSGEQESCNSKRVLCECGVYLPNRSCHQLHRLYYCTRKSRSSTVEGLQNTIGLQNDADLPTSTYSCSDLVCPSASSSSKKLKRSKSKWSIYESNTVTPNACPYCIGLVFCDRKALRHHLMRNHMEHFFPNIRNENLVSVEQFQTIATKLLFADIISDTQLHRDACFLCGRKIKPGSTGAMRIIRIKEHFVGQHYEYLKEKLCSIQEDPNGPGRSSNLHFSC